MVYPVNKNTLVNTWRDWYFSTVDGIHKNRFTTQSGRTRSCDLMSMNAAKLLVDEMCTYITNELTLPEMFEGIISEDTIDIICENTLAYGNTLILTLNDTQSVHNKTLIIYPASLITTGKDKRGKEFISATNPTTQRRVNIYDNYNSNGVWVSTTVDVWDTKTNKKESTYDYTTFKPYRFFKFEEDLQYPYGKALFADAIPALKTMDLMYTNWYREFVLGVPRVITTKEALRVEEIKPTKAELEINPNAKPKFRQYLNEDDEVFVVINRPHGVEQQQDVPIKQIQFDLRYEAYIHSINFQLTLAGKHSGYDNGFFSFDGSGIARTATEVISIKSDLFKNISAYQKRLANLLADIAFEFGVMIADINSESGRMRYLEPSDIRFGDGIYIDDNQKKQDGITLKNIGAIDTLELLTKYYNYTEADALAVLARVKAETPILTGFEDYGLFSSANATSTNVGEGDGVDI